MNVYHYGQSLFKIEYCNKKLKWTSHKKYIGLNEEGYIDAGCYLDRLEEMKESAKKFGRKEKEQVKFNFLSSGDFCVIDTEITFGREEKYGRRSVDFLTVEKDEHEKLKLVFYEAKLFDNPELRAVGTPKVFSQMDKYEQALRDTKHRIEILNSYKTVYENIKALNLKNKSKLVQLIGPNIESLDISSEPNLIIFINHSYTENDKHVHRLQEHFGNQRIKLVRSFKPPSILSEQNDR